MYKSPSISFFVTGMAVIASASCNIKDGFLDAPSQFPQSVEEEVILNALMNTTNLTLLPHFPYSVRLPPNNQSIHNLEKLDRELFADAKKVPKTCMKNATRSSRKAIADSDYHPTLRQLTTYLFTSIPPFDLSSTEGVSRKCRKRSFHYKQDLKKFKLWALKMYDASAKLPSGFLNGNINQLGDFDLCLSVNSENWNIKGQYCLASLQVETPHNPTLSGIHNLLHSHSLLRSRLEDPGHRVPRFSSINWALCVPNSCTAKDVQLGLRKSMARIINGTELEVKLEVDPAMCQSATPKSVPLATLLASGFFATVILIAAVSTIYDYHAENKNRLFLAFSLRRNLRTVLSTERPPNDLEAVHGIRFVNAFMPSIHSCTSTLPPSNKCPDKAMPILTACRISFGRLGPVRSNCLPRNDIM